MLKDQMESKAEQLIKHIFTAYAAEQQHSPCKQNN